MACRGILLLLFVHCAAWDLMVHLDDEDQLLCHSCQGAECEQLSKFDKTTVVCNKKTQLCWAGFVNQQAYRTCANRYCTPNEISLDSTVSIETCCRSSFCNSVPLDSPTPSSTAATTTVNSENDAFYDEEEEEAQYLIPPDFNASDPNSFGVNWERLSYNGDTASHLISLNCIGFFILALLLV